MSNLFMSRPTGVLKLKVMNNIYLKSGFRYLIGLIVEASESVNDCGQFHLFGIFLHCFFFRVFRGHIAVFCQESETILFKPFFLSILFLV